MAILANTNGSLISVVATDKPNVWRENCLKGSIFTIKEHQSHRKVFTGANAVLDAETWVSQQRAARR